MRTEALPCDCPDTECPRHVLGPRLERIREAQRILRDRPHSAPPGEGDWLQCQRELLEIELFEFRALSTQ